MPRLDSLSIQGFRSFADLQTLSFDSDLAIFYGPNSQGKTSLAEAIEFLFTGAISRRALLASAQDEFADSLRNAHIPASMDVFVEACVIDNSGIPHSVRRQLTADYSRRASCSSVLTIDSVVATDADITSLGVEILDPPLAAPILMQHTLGYLFSAQPQKRSEFFKALLEVVDLDQLHSTVVSCQAACNEPEHECLTAFDNCISTPDLTAALSVLTTAFPTQPLTEAALYKCVVGLLVAGEVDPEESFGKAVEQLRSLLLIQRERAFPVDGFARVEDVPAWHCKVDDECRPINDYITLRKGVSTDVAARITLFSAVLNVPAVADITEPLDCPVCETRNALTSERIAVIQAEVESAANLVGAKQIASAALAELLTRLTRFDSSHDQLCPTFLRWSICDRRERGFSVPLLRSLLGEEHNDLINQWISTSRMLARSLRRSRAATASAVGTVRICTEQLSALEDTLQLETSLHAVHDCVEHLVESIAEYKAAANSLRPIILAVIDNAVATDGWEELISLCDDPQLLAEQLGERFCHRQLMTELNGAANELEEAKLSVLDVKFADLSGEVRGWWDRLRPEEPTYFHTIGRRPGGRRNIDFKAGLAADVKRANVKIRDVIAIFSQSQLTCLGLATFFARRVTTPPGFIVLDDPLATIDDSYAAHFVHSVTESLLDSGMQVIVLTYEQRLRKALMTRYQHENAECFELTLDDPVSGSSIVKTSDSLAMMFCEAAPFTKSSNLAHRRDGARKLRVAAERLCKEILVAKRRANGDTQALVTDYSQTLGPLIILLTPYLESTDEPGKLNSIGQSTNPGNHDDDIPSMATLGICLGDMRRFKRVYL